MPAIRRAQALRTGAAALAVTALTVTGLGVPHAASAAPESTSEAAPAVSPLLPKGSAWLSKQLTGGLIHSSYDIGEGPVDYIDYGLSIDVARTLHEVGQQPAAVTAVADAMARDQKKYTEPGWGTIVAAGAVAKTALLAQDAGRDAADFGGQDLIGTLEQRVADSGATRGRLSDELDPTDQWAADYANTFGQAYAVEALAAADSPETQAATDFLLLQQCAAGGFRQSFSEPEAADQSCAGSSDSTVNVDATALAVSSLQERKSDPAVAAALGRATTWLLGQQQPDGAFSDNADHPASANSTGLAAVALAEQGEQKAAAEAGVWIGRHQVNNVGACTTYPNRVNGAIALNDGALDALDDGVDATDELAQWRRSASQALPALRYAPAASGPIKAKLTPASTFLKAGSTQKIKVTGLAATDEVCVDSGAGKAGRDSARPSGSAATASVKVPNKTGAVTIRVASVYGATSTVRVTTLAAKKLNVTAKGKVKRGARQAVTIKGLKPGEKAKVKLGGKTVAQGKAGASGKFVGRFTVKVKPGKHKVKGIGQFSTRTGTATFRVVR